MKNILRTVAVLVACVLAVAFTTSAAPDEHGHDHGHKHGRDHPAGEKKEDKHDHAPGAEHEHHDEVTLTADAIQRYGIKLATVSKQKLAPTLTVPARVSFNAEAMAHVGSAVSGRAVEIKVRVGDRVKKGDELIVVESPELGEAQSDYIQKRTAVAVAKSAVEPAQSNAERARRLHDQNQSIALGEVQKREAEAKAAEGALLTAQAAATAAEKKLHLLGIDQRAVEELARSSEIQPKFPIRAPIDGQVIEREVTLGELVSPEKEALLVLADVSTLWVIADVPESRLREVQVGAKAGVLVGAVSSEPVEGKVSFIAVTLDANTRAAQVRLEIPNGEGALRPGMFATAQIASATPGNGEAVIAVPDEAVQTVEGGPAVFVPCGSDGTTFEKRAVKVGRSVGGMIPITSGLEVGDRVVVSGSFVLKAEMGKGGAAHEH